MPRKAQSLPSSSRLTNRQRPPCRASKWSTFTSSGPPHHFATRVGAVSASNTTSLGASKVRVITMSCRPGSMTISVLAMVLFLSLALELVDFAVQPFEPIGPDLAVLRDPLRGAVQRCRLESAGTPLGVPRPGDQPGPFEHLEVFGDRLKADVERLGQLVDRCLAVGQPRQDGSPGGVGQGGEGEAELIGCHFIQPFS